MTVSRWCLVAGGLWLFAPGCTLFVAPESYHFGADGGIDAGALDASADGGLPGCAMASDCTAAAHAVMECREGECVISGCQSGWDDCDGVLGNGCETNVSADVDNCGACMLRCDRPNAETSCVSGSCRIDSCVGGYADCDTEESNGCERSLRTDTDCGECDRACLSDRPLCETSGAAPVCVESCSGTSTLCGSTCADLEGDPMNCGACETVCPDVPNATPTCTSRACTFTCLMGRGDCTSAPGCETNTMTSVAHCGGCDTACTGANATMECVGGGCGIASCAANYGDCNSMAADGCEADLLTSPLHCGGCDMACPAGCVGGVCDPIVDIALGYAASCAVRTSGQVFCWGTNDRGQLGQGDPNPHALPSRVPGLGGVGFLDAIDVSLGAESPSQATVCAVLRDGSLACWGNNTYGTAGSDTSGNHIFSPRAVTSLDPAFTDGRRFVSVSTSFETSCAVDDAGELWCWGRNTAGELGVAPVPAPGIPLRNSAERVAFAPGVLIEEVRVGVRYVCARTTTGRVLCWGQNSNGNLGDGTIVSRHTPMPTVPAIDDATSISTGTQHVCALRADRRVWCWGVGTEGQLGQGAGVSSRAPIEATEFGTDVRAIAVGHYFTFATTGAGTYLGVGRDSSGELGRGTALAFRLTAASPLGVAPGATLFHGSAAVCALRGASATCWGDDRWGQLAIDEGLVRATPVEVALSGITAISLGESAGCLRAAGAAFCFGRGQNGQLGSGASVPSSTPRRTTIATMDRPSAGNLYACGINGGQAYCWGTSGNGRLGTGDTVPTNTPVLVALAGSETRVAASGAGHTCAIQSAGSVHCWGYNATGALGRGTMGADELMPGPPVMGIDDALEISAGTAFTCALRGSGAVACWGAGTVGQLGTGALSHRASALDVPGLTNVIQVAAGANHACAIVGASAAATQGTVFCWGENFYGAVGDPLSNAPHPVPFAVGGGLGITDAIAIGTGAFHSCALRSTGAILCWGTNDAMQLGDGTRETRTAPVTSHAVSGAVGLSTGASGVRTQCAYRADGSAVCWGYGPEVMTGSGEPIAVATPSPMLTFGGAL